MEKNRVIICGKNRTDHLSRKTRLVSFLRKTGLNSCKKKRTSQMQKKRGLINCGKNRTGFVGKT